jgi:hypothetical protein
MTKCTLRLPRFTASNGPPPKLLKEGVPVATCAEVVVASKIAVIRNVDFKDKDFIPVLSLSYSKD